MFDTCNGCGITDNFNGMYISDDGILCKTCCSYKYPNVTHEHSWKHYVGFTEAYMFCECGEKTPIT